MKPHMAEDSGKKRVLVTGGAGFIGSHVVDLLLEQGHRVAVVDNLSTGRRENVNPQAEFFLADVGSPDLAAVLDAVRPQAVVHLAAQASVSVSVADPVRDATANILGSVNLLQQCVRTGVEKFVYVSTGGALYGEPQYLPCDENHPINPLSPYGVSKHTVEHYLYFYRQVHGLAYTVLRLANVYGPRQDPFGEAGVVAIFTQRMLDGEQVVIYGSGEQERDFVFVMDCARAAVLALSRGDGEAYNIGCGRGTTVNVLFAMMKSLTGYAREPRYDPPRPGDVFRSFLNADKARRELGWEPSVSLEEGLRQTIAHFRQGSKPR
ncbi:MAG: SDR family oxidoreductase [Anaerolineales bacterium]